MFELRYDYDPVDFFPHGIPGSPKHIGMYQRLPLGERLMEMICRAGYNESSDVGNWYDAEVQGASIIARNEETGEIFLCKDERGMIEELEWIKLGPDHHFCNKVQWRDDI